MRLAATLLIIAGACSAPQRRGLTREDAMRVAVDMAHLPAWYEAIVAGAEPLRQHGGVWISFVPTYAEHDVTIRRGYANNCVWAGIYYEYDRTIYLDPRCLHGATQVVSISAHELGHAAGAMHVCPSAKRTRSPGECVGSSSTALMLHNLPYEDDGCDPASRACIDAALQRITWTSCDTVALRRRLRR